jgi:hypothetical protein
LYFNNGVVMRLSGIEAFKVYADRILGTTISTFITVGLLLSTTDLLPGETFRYATGFSMLTFLLTTLYACVFLPHKLQ